MGVADTLRIGDAVVVRRDGSRTILTPVADAEGAVATLIPLSVGVGVDVEIRLAVEVRGVSVDGVDVVGPGSAAGVDEGRSGIGSETDRGVEESKPGTGAGRASESGDLAPAA